LQAQAQPGGAEKLEKAVPETDRKVIDQNLASDMVPLRKTMMAPGEGLNLPLYSAVQEAVRTLAYSNTLKGQGGEAALASAVDSVLNQKFDMEGTLRTPKGVMAKAQALGGQIQNGLTAADIAPPPHGNPALTDDQNAQIVADAARRNGAWMANSRDDGAQLMATLRDGSRVPVIRRNGMPVQMMWSDLAGVAQPAPAAAAGVTSYDGQNPAPSWRLHMPTGPDMGQVTNRPVGAALGDWIHNRPALQ
jgi:hypothetical protein